MSESWPFSCPAPTELLSRSFSFQSAFSSFSMVGITVNRTQQVLSRSAQGCTRWHEKYILSNKIRLTPNYFLSLSSAFLMALIEEDIWGAEGQRLFVSLGEVFECLSGSIFGQRKIQGQLVKRICEIFKARRACWWKTLGQGEFREQQPFNPHVRDRTKSNKKKDGTKSS